MISSSISKVFCFNSTCPGFSSIISILGMIDYFTVLYSICLMIRGTLVKARNCSFATPHSSDLFIRIRKFCWNSVGPTNFMKSSVFFRIKNSDYAGNSLALQSFYTFGQMYSLNSVVVKKLGLSIIAKIFGRTFTESWIIFIWSSSKGITFLSSAFLSNFSRILVIPCKNWTLLIWSLLSKVSRYLIVFSNGS